MRLILCIALIPTLAMASGWVAVQFDSEAIARNAATDVSNTIGGSVVYVDASERSMYPAIQDSGYAVMLPASINDITVGTVVLSAHGDISAIHRVVRKRDGYVLTKGDNNRRLDAFKTYQSNLRGIIAPIIFTWALNKK